MFCVCLVSQASKYPILEENKDASGKHLAPSMSSVPDIDKCSNVGQKSSRIREECELNEKGDLAPGGGNPVDFTQTEKDLPNKDIIAGKCP